MPGGIKILFPALSLGGETLSCTLLFSKPIEKKSISSLLLPLVYVDEYLHSRAFPSTPQLLSIYGSILCYLSYSQQSSLQSVHISQNSLEWNVSSAAQFVSSLRRDSKPLWGQVDIVYEHEQPDLGVYCLYLNPNTCIPAHYHLKMSELEIPLTKGLVGVGELPCRLLGRQIWTSKQIHGYWNHTNRVQRILCVDIPRFDPNDEIVVDIESWLEPTVSQFAPLSTLERSELERRGLKVEFI